MKFFILSFSFLFLYSCAGMKNAKENQREQKTLHLEPDEDGEYDVIVLDPSYGVFLNTRALPMNYYSEEFLHSKNIRLVNEWNYRHSQPMRFNPNVYEVHIDYRPSIKYGLEFEWKLFNFFMFIESQTGEDLDGHRTYAR
ncbi:DUF6146 family protein [Candidatus Ornithobacterium hominis]|uniref:DUF6146 family protein n=1 Tax=Candidatus Ornithobacterium hominis TaxID=2497989 RepID=UPI0024BCBBCE|nr:DUF6146 family protein [Candidatus Ornithobacterium hominis]